MAAQKESDLRHVSLATGMFLGMIDNHGWARGTAQAH